jgi:hypothetical protein
MASNEKFWMYDVTQLFRSFDLLPNPEDSLSTKLNTITRLALIVCIVIAAYKPVLAFSTLIIIMVVTMSVYSGTTPVPTIERFEAPESHESNQQLYEFMREYNSTRYPDHLNKMGFPSTQKRFCNDAVPFEYGPNHVSLNQELVGGPNPKTRIPPLIAAPSHDLDSWRNNDFAVHSQINKETNFDAERSGYNWGTLPTKCEECMYVPCQCKVLHGSHPPRIHLPELVEGFRDFQRGARGGDVQGDGGRRRPDVMSPSQRKMYIKNLINDVGENRQNKPFIRKYVRDVFLDRRLGEVSDIEIDEIIAQLMGKISTSSKNQDEELQMIPCFESPRRDNIITQTIQPGVFQKSHIGEPIQSNIGISYTQEWGPTEVQETDDMIKYTMYDPGDTIITPRIKEETIGQDHSNVYDPRFTGYGTSYRSYTDRLTGRPKFFYDDVDAITMPNYVTRSKVDVFPWANTYGPDKMMSVSEGDEYRQLANNAFTDSTIAFRTELQERLMRKRNAELWQRRAAPISTMGRLGTSMRSCL